jgi:hypothetical protein
VFCGRTQQLQLVKYRRLRAKDYRHSSIVVNNISTGWAAMVSLSNGDGTFAKPITNGQVNCNPPNFVTTAFTDPWQPIMGDINGDGKTDLVVVDIGKSGWATQAVVSNGTGTDLLKTITTGIGATTTITYQPLTNSSVYSKGNSGAYPIEDVQSSMFVVSQVDTSNGVVPTSGPYSTTYSYAGAQLDLSGRGFLGFSRASSTDLQTNIVHTTNAHQDYPFIGLTASETKVLGAVTLNSVTNCYQVTNASGGGSAQDCNQTNCVQASNAGSTVSTPTSNSAPYRVTVYQSCAASSDLSGATATLPTVTTTSQYDSYGNPTQVVVSTPDGFSKTTTNTYNNDTTNWFLGRLTTATVTSTTP